MTLELKDFGRCVAWAGGWLALLVMVSCAATRDPDPVMGNTNWLHACESDRDCSAGLSCECGVCTRVCASSTDCEGLPGAVCDSASELSNMCGASSSASLCLMECGDEACDASDGGDRIDAGDVGSDGGPDAGNGGEGDAGGDAGPLDCQGPNPAGCFAEGCPSGQRCVAIDEDECVPSACSCDTATGSWVCNTECSGPSECVAIESVDCEGILTFVDPVLEELVRVAIVKPSGDILAADVASLTDLSNDGVGVDGTVTSLQGIQCLTTLTSLTIRFGQITDLTPLTALESLRFVTLSDHPELSDLSPFAQLGSLTALFITDTLVQDVSPLSGLAGLTELALEDNRIRDIRPLEGLSSLDLLWLLGNPLDCELSAGAITSLEDGGADVDAPQCE